MKTLKPIDVQHIYEEIFGFSCSKERAEDILFRYNIISKLNKDYSIYTYLKSIKNAEIIWKGKVELVKDEI